MKFKIQQGHEFITSHSGLSLLGALLDNTKIAARCNQISLPDHPRPTIPHSDIVHSMIGLLCLGKPDFEAIEVFREDDFFRLSLGIDQTPSEGSLRQRLDDAEGAFDQVLKEEAVDMVGRHAPRLTPCYQAYVPLDADVSPFDNSHTQKEGVMYTYQGMEGYAPMFAYLGEEGYLVNAALREGNQHCQKGTPAFLRESVRLARRATTAPLLVRLDAGHDSEENRQVCRQEQVDWIIKRNLRNESPDFWIDLAFHEGRATTLRPGKTVYKGEMTGSPDEKGHCRQWVYQVTVREMDETGQLLLTPEIEVDTFDTSLQAPAETIIELYQAHATCEQYHSEIKSDMMLERLPSGKFATNAAVLLLGLVAYNGLRLMGQDALREEGVPPEKQAPIRKKVSRRRLRSVMQDLIYMASRVVWHARQWILSFGRFNPWYPVWQRLYEQWTAPPLPS